VSSEEGAPGGGKNRRLQRWKVGVEGLSSQSKVLKEGALHLVALRRLPLGLRKTLSIAERKKKWTGEGDMNFGKVKASFRTWTLLESSGKEGPLRKHHTSMISENWGKVGKNKTHPD